MTGADQYTQVQTVELMVGGNAFYSVYAYVLKLKIMTDS